MDDKSYELATRARESQGRKQEVTFLTESCVLHPRVPLPACEMRPHMVQYLECATPR
jgi:hypothetical protein